MQTLEPWLRPFPRPSRIDSIMIAIMLGFGGWMAFIVVPAPQTSDAYADWLFSSAVLDRVDPYQTLEELGNLYGNVYEVDVANPRLPGAALPMAPLGLLSAEGVRHLNNTLNIVAVVVVLWLSAGRVAMPVAALILADTSFYQWANHMYWIVALVVAGLFVRSQTLGGVLIGFAAAVKLWPMAVAAGLWSNQRKRANIGVVVFVALTAIGAVVIETTMPRAIDAMGETARLFAWSVSNGSPTSAGVKLGVTFDVAAGASTVVGGLWWLRHRTVEASLVVAFLISPLVWSGYQLVMAPFVAARVRAKEVVAVAIVIVFLVQGYSGWWRLLITLLMIVAIELRPHRERQLRSDAGAHFVRATLPGTS